MGFLSGFINKRIQGEREKQATLKSRGNFAKEVFKSTHEITSIGEKGALSEQSRQVEVNRKNIILLLNAIGDDPTRVAELRKRVIYSLRSKGYTAEVAGSRFDRWYEDYQHGETVDEDED